MKNNYGEFDVVVKLLESDEGLIRICSGNGLINIFEVKSEALKQEDELEDAEYNPAKPNNYYDMVQRKKAILKQIRQHLA